MAEETCQHIFTRWTLRVLGPLGYALSALACGMAIFLVLLGVALVVAVLS